jgi:hypothetical protein
MLPSAKKAKPCRLIIHPPTQDHQTAQNHPITRAQKHKKLRLRLRLKQNPKPQTPLNKALSFPSCNKATNDIRFENENRLLQLGVTPLINKSNNMGDMGLSGVSMEDEERGEKGERHYGIGFWMAKEEGRNREMWEREIWLRTQLWGRGRWAVRGVDESTYGVCEVA